jgi:hypothetical protein
MATSRRVLLASGLGLGVLYAAAVLFVSLISRERTLAVGEPLRFCGLYLDCHLSAAVAGVAVAQTAAGAMRYTVRVRFESDAVAATLTFDHPRAYLVGADRVRVRSVSGPENLTLAAGTAVTADFVFDAPRLLDSPRLAVSKGGLLERLTEKFLIGDPDSVLHAPVLLALQ